MIAIIVAAIHNSELMVKYLVEIGQDVNASSVTGSTPLYQAASNNNVSLVKFLLSKGADVTHRTKEGRTSLYITKNPEIAKMLLEKGADINSVTNVCFSVILTNVRIETLHSCVQQKPGNFKWFISY
jgi:ankyrin repeat protein